MGMGRRKRINAVSLLATYACSSLLPVTISFCGNQKNVQWSVIRWRQKVGFKTCGKKRPWPILRYDSNRAKEDAKYLRQFAYSQRCGHENSQIGITRTSYSTTSFRVREGNINYVTALHTGYSCLCEQCHSLILQHVSPLFVVTREQVTKSKLRWHFRTQRNFHTLWITYLNQ
jgi:hypothetical protein